MLPIVYKWTDGNAPVARGERKSLNDILYACLVTGYGEKPGAGWTREYVNATEDQAAYRNNPVTGTGLFLRVSGPLSPIDFGSQVVGYETMTSDADGLNAFYNNTVCYTSNGVGTTARPWILIADDRAFYFYCWTGSTGTGLPPTGNASFGFFFGDLTGCAADDAYGCGHTVSVYGYSNRSPIGYMYPPQQATASGYFSIAVARKRSGAVGAYLGVSIFGGGPAGETDAGYDGMAYTTGGPIFISRPHINEGAAYTFRGFWPGLWYPCHPLAFGQFQEVTVDGRSFISLRVSIDDGYGNLFISLDDWRS